MELSCDYPLSSEAAQERVTREGLYLHLGSLKRTYEIQSTTPYYEHHKALRQKRS